MRGRTIYVLRLLFVAYVLVTAAHIAYVVNHEPFAFDAWNVAVDSRAEPITVGRFFEFWKSQYLSSNPRVGQPLAYLTYKVVGFGEVGTTLSFFAIVLAAFVIGLGRLPSWRRGIDLAVLTIAIGFLWFVAPEFGSLLFCRAYATNYVWAAALQLWFVVVLRLHVGRNQEQASGPKLIACAALGVIAGACNEHTGPTLVLFAAILTWWQWRQTRLLPKVLLSSTIGAVVGFALIFLAPGQGQRYDGLAQRLSLTDRLFARGISANLDIFEDLLYSAGPLLVVLVVVIIMGSILKQRGQVLAANSNDGRVGSLRLLGIMIAAGVLITVTVFVSPKLGSRFYLHSMLLLLAAFLGVLSAHLHSARSYVAFVVLAVLSSGYAIARTVPLFTRLKHDADQRIADLTAAPRGSTYTADSWEQIPGSWWFLGDDFRDQKKRELVAKYFALKRVVFRGLNPWAALGVSDVRLIAKYEFDQAICLDEEERVEIEPYVGRDIPAIHHAFLDAVAEIHEANIGRLKSMDLGVFFQGEKPPMPRPKLYVAKWRDGTLEGYLAKIHRSGRSRTREINLSDKVVAHDWQIYLVAVGDEPRLLGPVKNNPVYTYIPWRSGAYWVLACDLEQCWVLSATFHRI
jgi:hypothetical protein